MCWDTVEWGTDLRRPHRASSALICFFTEIMCQVSAEDTSLQAERGKLRGWGRDKVCWAGGGQDFGKGLSQWTQGPGGRRPRGGSSRDDRRPVGAGRKGRAGPGVGSARGSRLQLRSRHSGDEGQPSLRVTAGKAQGGAAAPAHVTRGYLCLSLT